MEKEYNNVLKKINFNNNCITTILVINIISLAMIIGILSGVFKILYLA